MRVSVLRTLADRMSALHHRSRYQRPSVKETFAQQTLKDLIALADPRVVRPGVRGEIVEG